MCLINCDAKRIAKDVDATFHEIIARHGGMDAAVAVEYVKQLKQDHRCMQNGYRKISRTVAGDARLRRSAFELPLSSPFQTIRLGC